MQLPSSSSSFLSKSYCSENLEFYDAVDQFRHLWRCSGTASMTDDQRRAMADGAQHIWNHYVAPVPHILAMCVCVCRCVLTYGSGRVRRCKSISTVTWWRPSRANSGHPARTHQRSCGVLCVIMILCCFSLCVRSVHFTFWGTGEQMSLTGACAPRVCAGRCLMKPRTL